MKNKINKLGKTIVKLHECSKKGNKKTGYGLFKQAVKSLMEVQSQGVKSPVLKTVKSILAEYTDEYASLIAKDRTRVVVQGRKPTDPKILQQQRHDANRKSIKDLNKELITITNNIRMVANKKTISSNDFESISLYADQIIKMANRIKVVTKDQIDDYLE